jgi:hypothetical protein
VLSGYDVIKEALVKQGTVFSGRPFDFVSAKNAHRKGIKLDLDFVFSTGKSAFIQYGYLFNPTTSKT